jgi:hypothetical protein
MKKVHFAQPVSYYRKTNHASPFFPRSADPKFKFGMHNPDSIELGNIERRQVHPLPDQGNQQHQAQHHVIEMPPEEPVDGHYHLHRPEQQVHREEQPVENIGDQVELRQVNLQPHQVYQPPQVDHQLIPIQQHDIDRHAHRLAQLEEFVHRIPPFSCRDVAEIVVPLGFLGGSIMFIINDFTNKDGFNGKSFAGNVMTGIASISGLGLVLHNWWDRAQQAAARRRRREPAENV